jgi:5-methylcytosine-specific restriction endonuclease McrA
MIGRKRKYCKRECRLDHIRSQKPRPTHCQVCGKELPIKTTAGNPRRYCSKKCREKARTIKNRKPKQTLNCQNCKKEFQSCIPQKYCSKPCRLVGANVDAKAKYQANRDQRYPGGMRTTNCGWCNEPRTWKIGESVINAFHPDCTIDAQRARYRLKTTRRQKVSNPNRLSADKIVEIYGQNCHICLEPISLELPRTSKLGLTVDHVIPISKGGDDNIENLRPAHWICNIRKSNKLPKEVNA